MKCTSDVTDPFSVKRHSFPFWYLLGDYWHDTQYFPAALEHICVCALYSQGCQVISLCSPIHSLCQTTLYDSNGSLKAWQRRIPFAVWQGWAAMVRAHLVPHLPSTPFPLTRALFSGVDVESILIHRDIILHKEIHRFSVMPSFQGSVVSSWESPSFLFFWIVSWFPGQRGADSIKR